jgi:hypothetical protein
MRVSENLMEKQAWLPPIIELKQANDVNRPTTTHGVSITAYCLPLQDRVPISMVLGIASE